MIINLEIISKMFSGLTDLSQSQTLYIRILAKVIMIGQYKKFIFITLEVLISNLKLKTQQEPKAYYSEF